MAQKGIRVPDYNEETISQLERLAKLREQGVLTEAEFLAQKSQILGTAGANSGGTTPPTYPVSPAGPNTSWSNTDQARPTGPMPQQQANYWTGNATPSIAPPSVQSGRGQGYGPQVSTPAGAPPSKLPLGKYVVVLGLVLLACMLLGVFSNSNKKATSNGQISGNNTASQAGSSGNSSQPTATTIQPTQKSVAHPTLNPQEAVAATQTVSAKSAGNRPKGQVTSTRMLPRIQ